MRIGVVRETTDLERRVALTPDEVRSLCANEHDIRIERGAGRQSGHDDEHYRKAGARIAADKDDVLRNSQVLLKVQPPDPQSEDGRAEIDMMPTGLHYVGFLSPFTDLSSIKAFAEKKMTVFSLQMVPRITRAQGMDALSAMATVAGYKAVLIAANRIGKFFPLLMTAAGTITPAGVLVLGAGVAGLQAIATAKRLGARVEAFDPRSAVKEQVQSLGARFVEMELPEATETSGGYAKQQSEDFLRQEQKVIGRRLNKTDVVITTALVFGKKAPVLLTEEMVSQMKSGSVIVDLAAAQGGNCELTRPDETVDVNGITILGPTNLPSMVPVHASQMLARNMSNLFQHLYRTERLDVEDEIVHSTCLMTEGRICNDMVRQAFELEEEKL